MSRRYHERIQPDNEKRNKTEHIQDYIQHFHQMTAPFRETCQVIGQKSAEVIVAKRPE